MSVSDVGFCRNEAVLWREAGGALVCLPQGHDKPIVIDGSGPDLWALLEEPISAGEAAVVLGRFYGVPVDSITRDIATVLELLRGLDIVRVTEAPS